MSIARARQLRKTMTQWEVRLWSKLRGDATGARFRRQHPIGRYIVDFASIPARLIIEVDGLHHRLSTRDAARDAWLCDQGWQVLRISNHQVQWQLYEVCHGIAQAVRERLGR